MENHLATEDAGDEDDWLVSHLVTETNLEDEFDILDEDGEIIKQTAEQTTAAADDDADEYQDMDGFEDDDILQDDAAAATSENVAQQESNLLKTRTVRINSRPNICIYCILSWKKK